MNLLNRPKPAIITFSVSAENRKILHEQEVEKMLIILLSNEDPNVQMAAANAIGVMAENLLSRSSVGQWGKYLFELYHNYKLVLSLNLYVII